jgi:hypothetical protein
MINNILMTFLLLILSPLAFSLPGNFSGEISLELRDYPEDSAYDNGEGPKGEGSIFIKPEYNYAWDQDRKIITIIPYYRENSEDEVKSHFDLREFSFVGSYGQYEVRAGISKVFWGTTESQHLVDIINQSDFVENPDGEDKLGQAMLNLTYVSNDYGNFDFFVLPGFRERTFSGEDGRFRIAVPVKDNEAIYLNSQKENHIDSAFRWSHYYKDLEWALSYFSGTDRDPIFTLKNNKLYATYGLTEQYGLELQYVYESWLIKSETIKKNSDVNDEYHASVNGFEYTLSNIYGGKDLGFIMEWQWDERLDENPVGISNGGFYALRLAVNDAASTEVLAGQVIDLDTGKLVSTRVEASRRIGQSYKLEFEFSNINDPKENTLLYSIKEDDYSQISLSYFW